MPACGPDGRRAVVIGGGLLGIEAAYGLARAGLAVDLVHLMDRLMERQLDPRAAPASEDARWRARASSCPGGARPRPFEGRDTVEGVRLKDGRVLPADLVVVAVGIRPETTLARAGRHRLQPRHRRRRRARNVCRRNLCDRRMRRAPRRLLRPGRARLRAGTHPRRASRRRRRHVHRLRAGHQPQGLRRRRVLDRRIPRREGTRGDRPLRPGPARLQEARHPPDCRRAAAGRRRPVRRDRWTASGTRS